MLTKKQRIVAIIFGGLNILMIAFALYYLKTLDSNLEIPARARRASRPPQRRNLSDAPVEFTPELKKKLIVVSDCRPQYLEWSEGTQSEYLDALAIAARDRSDCLVNGAGDASLRGLGSALAKCDFATISDERQRNPYYAHPCLTDAARFRMLIVDQVTRTEDLQTLSAGVLAQKITALGIAARPPAEKAETLAQIGDALIRREPDLPQGYQAFALGTVNKILNANYSPSAAERALMEDAFDLLYEYPEKEAKTRALEYAFYFGVRDTARMQDIADSADDAQAIFYAGLHRALAGKNNAAVAVDYVRDFNFMEEGPEADEDNSR